MELAPLVPLRLASAVLGLARAELAKVLCSPGHDILEQFNLDPAKLFP